MSKEEYVVAREFIKQIRAFKNENVITDIKIDDKTCSLELADDIDVDYFKSTLSSNPPLLSYAILNKLELKINGDVIPEKDIKKAWEEALKYAEEKMNEKSKENQ